MKLKNKTATVLKVIIILAMFLVAFLTFNDLPDEIPTHWNIDGVPDKFSDKGKGAYLMPILTLVIAILLPFLAYIDPRKKNYEKFSEEWEAIQATFVVFMAYFYFAQLYVILNKIEGPLMNALIFAGIGLMFVLLGHFIRRIKSNFFVGIRTPWTIEDPVVWEKTHDLGGKFFMLAGLLFFLLAFMPKYFSGALIVGIILFLLIPVVYSYFLYRKRHS